MDQSKKKRKKIDWKTVIKDNSFDAE